MQLEHVVKQDKRRKGKVVMTEGEGKKRTRAGGRLSQARRGAKRKVDSFEDGGRQPVAVTRAGEQTDASASA